MMLRRENAEHQRRQNERGRRPSDSRRQTTPRGGSPLPGGATNPRAGTRSPSRTGHRATSSDSAPAASHRDRAETPSDPEPQSASSLEQKESLPRYGEGVPLMIMDKDGIMIPMMHKLMLAEEPVLI